MANGLEIAPFWEILPLNLKERTEGMPSWKNPENQYIFGVVPTSRMLTNSEVLIMLSILKPKNKLSLNYQVLLRSVRVPNNCGSFEKKHNNASIHGKCSYFWYQF